MLLLLTTFAKSMDLCAMHGRGCQAVMHASATDARPPGVHNFLNRVKELARL